jgi:hypothetical protein
MEERCQESSPLVAKAITSGSTDMHFTPIGIVEEIQEIRGI